MPGRELLRSQPAQASTLALHDCRQVAESNFETMRNPGFFRIEISQFALLPLVLSLCGPKRRSGNIPPAPGPATGAAPPEAIPAATTQMDAQVLPPLASL